MKKQNFPKVLVGGPTFDFHSYCLNDFENILKSLTYPNYETLLVDTSDNEDYIKELKRRKLKATKLNHYPKSRERIAESHNLLRKKVLEEDFDYLFLIDSDTIPPKDVIERLINHNKPIVSGLYFSPKIINDKIINTPIIRIKHPERNDQYLIPNKKECDSKKLIEITSSGTGCLLIHKSILQEFDFWYDNTTMACDDTFFFLSLIKKHIKCYCDTSVVCEHLWEDKPHQWWGKDNEENKY